MLLQILQWIFSANPVHVYGVIAMLIYWNLASKGKLPQVESIRRFASMLDDRGGNILVLGLLTCWFFIVTVKLFYHAIAMSAAGMIKENDAIMLLALNTVSSGFAGTCFGALLKTMNGAMTVAPPNATTPAGLPLERNKSDRTRRTDEIGSPPGVADATPSQETNA
jgi:hypothetical protein